MSWNAIFRPASIWRGDLNAITSGGNGSGGSIGPDNELPSMSRARMENDQLREHYMEGLRAGMNSSQSYRYAGLVADESLVDPEISRMQMIAMRLRLNHHEKMPFHHISTVETETRILIFVVQNDKYVVLEDDKGLFPSDALVTQLILLK